MIHYPLITDNESTAQGVVLILSTDPHSSSADKIELMFEYIYI